MIIALFIICVILIGLGVYILGFFPPPALSLAELAQMKSDDISVYSKEGYFSVPQFTHDGSHILYVATTRPAVKPTDREFGSSDWENDIWIMDPAGHNQTRVTRIGDIRQFYPDPVSDRLAYSRFGNGSTSIFILQDITSQPASIPGPLPYMYFSSWSPDGTRIAATGFNASDIHTWGVMADGNNIPVAGEEWSRLYIMNTDGSSPREIARVGTGQYDLRTESSWSPNRKMLAVPLYIRGESGLGVIDIDSGIVRKLTKNEDQTSDKFMRRDDAYPRWSPNGNLIVFIRKGDIWSIKPDGSGGKKLVSDGTVEYLSWNPDGTRLAFSADSYLGIVDPDGNNINRILNIQPGPLSWSPDGKTLTYAPGNGVRIRIMTLSPGVIAIGGYSAAQMENMEKLMRQ